MSDEHFKEIVEKCARLDVLSRKDKNYLIYDVYQTLKRQKEEGAASVSNTYQIKLSSRVPTSHLVQFIKPLALYSSRIIVFLDDSFGYHREHINEETTYYHPEGTLSLTWIGEVLRALLPAISSNRVLLVPSYLSTFTSSSWIPGTVYQDEEYVSDYHRQDFETYATLNSSFPILLKGDKLTKLVRKQGQHLAERIGWEEIDILSCYWSYIFKEIGIPYLNHLLVFIF